MLKQKSCQFIPSISCQARFSQFYHWYINGYQGKDDCHKICISVPLDVFPSSVTIQSFITIKMAGEKVINNHNFQIFSFWPP